MHVLKTHVAAYLADVAVELFEDETGDGVFSFSSEGCAEVAADARKEKVEKVDV